MPRSQGLGCKIRVEDFVFEFLHDLGIFPESVAKGFSGKVSSLKGCRYRR